jgi:hypothetical protein
MKPAMDVGNLAQWVGASVTFLAVLVALFKDEIIKWRRRPIFDISTTLQPPHCHMTILRYMAQQTAPTYTEAQCYYFRLWVENRGKTRADRVQVFVAKLFRRAADGTFKEYTNFLPMNLRWSHVQAPGGGPEIYAEGISPQMGKHCDIGHIIDPANRAECGEDLPGVLPMSTLFALDLEVYPNTLSHLLAPGTYRLVLRVAAGNSLPMTKILELTVTGKWFDNERQMFQDGIGLRVVTEDGL